MQTQTPNSEELVQSTSQQWGKAWSENAHRVYYMVDM